MLEKKKFRYTIHASAISRYANRNFDFCLQDLPIGSGQQFFLLRIYENEGISLYELGKLGYFDKGTVSRGVQKLEEAGYIRIEQDIQDRRWRHLYITEAAKPIIERLLEAREVWHCALTEGFTDEECLQAESILQRMAQNAKKYVQQQEGESWHKA